MLIMRGYSQILRSGQPFSTIPFLAGKVVTTRNHKDALSRVVVALESTSYYGIHIANYLSSCEELLPFKTLVYCRNAKMIANYKKAYIGLSKNDYIDAFIINDFARVGRIS